MRKQTHNPMNQLAWAGTVALGLLMAVGITREYHVQNPVVRQVVITQTKTVTKTIAAGLTATQREDLYWARLHAIESRRGKLLVKAKDKATSCKQSVDYCGHFMLGLAALKDIGCTSTKCRADRSRYYPALKQAKAYDRVLRVRYGCNFKQDWLRYTAWNQGCSGIKTIWGTARTGKPLGDKLRARMARNSSLTVSQIKRLGDKQAAIRFLAYWKQVWNNKVLSL